MSGERIRVNAVQDKLMHKGNWRYRDLPQMDDTQFRLWQQLMEARTGIVLPIERKTFLVTSLAIRMRELDIHELDDYYFRLTTGYSGIVEWETLVDRLTVHETRFFRDIQALEYVGKKYLASKDGILGNQNTIKIWSVGCATGEEPYSLAIALDYFMKNNNISGFLGITATDISLAALAVGRKGLYHRNRLKDLPIEYLQEYFEPVDLDHYQIKNHIRDRICFSKLNLMQLDDTPIDNMDIIFCQNVLIYFKREMRVKILDNLVSHLKPGGLLILAPGEIIGWKNKSVVQTMQKNVFAFKRIGVVQNG